MAWSSDETAPLTSRPASSGVGHVYLSLGRSEAEVLVVMSAAPGQAV